MSYFEFLTILVFVIERKKYILMFIICDKEHSDVLIG